MNRLADLAKHLLHPHGDAAAERARVTSDRRRADYHAERIERSTSAIEHRVYEENHISAAVSALLKGRRT